MDFLKIRKQIYETGFDEFYQAGFPNRFSKMNVVAISRQLNKQFWICVDGGYHIKDSYFIAYRPLDDTSTSLKRVNCKNQKEVVDELKKIADEIMKVKSVAA